MKDERRNQLIDIVKKEFIGPDPLDGEGMTQESGEEILSYPNNPLERYIAGILFPQEVTETNVQPPELDLATDEDEIELDNLADDKDSGKTTGVNEYLEDAEELIDRSNAYLPSAMSVTVAVKDNDIIRAEVLAGRYQALTSCDSEKEREYTKFLRKQIYWTNDDSEIVMPTANKGICKLPVNETDLQFDITYRYRRDNYTIYTFTLENTKRKRGSSVNDDECFFQVGFKIFSNLGFYSLPDNQRIDYDNAEFQSNQLMYRNVKNYAIGHGCSADWEESENRVKTISTKTFPTFELKPIVPSTIPGVELQMLQMSDKGDFSVALRELNTLCDEYESWISRLKLEIEELDVCFEQTAKRHIDNCKTCLQRMRNGVDLLEEDSEVQKAFQLMNRAMLLQQLHYNLPLQKWLDDGKNGLILENTITSLPIITDQTTWYNASQRVYGKWRPFQIAFILMNLEAMRFKDSAERDIVDLIWFPTGGGKTEAYLGLSAYTIFLRRLMNKDDAGTVILMRYTLRLLTAQQYERASSLICACEMIRRENQNILGKERISIGLWVGATTTPNKMSDAVRNYNKLSKGDSDKNVFVMLKCPWCGAEMGTIQKKSGSRSLQGYRLDVGKHKKRKVVFQCANESHCDFSSSNNPLPLFVVDDSIYEEKPTLLLGTVDKFAMLPFRPEAQGLFGFVNGKQITSPDLIIQDELHLISGPLGSMVGHYESLISELCSMETPLGTIRPKIIASTATISRASEQCHALYACGKENVFQFPPSGFEAGDSFFAKEDREQKGRTYVGIMSMSRTSNTTAAIRLFSALLYGAKDIEVEEDNQRDPYWTNIGYFNSIRELGQAATWINADIANHLDTIYKRKYLHKRYSKSEYLNKRRYIWRDEELTSRIRSDKVTASLANLGIQYPPKKDKNGKIREHPIDICLATNMISVGLDVSRLGLMTVLGQPKTTSEYIQATSRVGRDFDKSPGLIFVLYKPGRPRDRSHYEHFKSYHSRIYCNVEPTSVTPFSAPVRNRALHAALIGMMRLQGDDKFNSDPPTFPSNKLSNKIQAIFGKRVLEIDPEEQEATIKHIEDILEKWEDWQPQRWEPKWERDGSYGSALPLMYHSGRGENAEWLRRGFETPTSMRNVDATCEVKVLANRYK